MRKRLLTLAAACLTTLGFASQASAQAGIGAGGVLRPEEESGFLVGPIGGLNVVSYSTSAFAMLNEEPGCFQAQNGSGIAPFAGITAEFPLDAATELQNFIVGEVIFDSRQGKFTAENAAAARREIMTKKNGVEAPGSVETAASADLSYLLFNVAYKYNFVAGPTPVGPGFQIGPSVGLKMASSITKDVTVSASSGDAGSPLKTDATSNTDEVTDAEGIRIAIRGMATYDIALNNDWVATPTVGYDFPITKVDQSRDWRVQGLFGGVAFRYFFKG